jgi:hypothetical protein
MQFHCPSPSAAIINLGLGIALSFFLSAGIKVFFEDNPFFPLFSHLTISTWYSNTILS